MLKPRVLVNKKGRDWLNKDQGMIGSISYEAHLELYKEDDTFYLDHNASLNIADCNRGISLVFYAGTVSQAKDRISKINKIRKALDIIEQSLLLYITEKEKVIKENKRAK